MSSEGTAQPPPPASNDAAPAPAADAPPPAAAEPPKEDTAALSSTANDNAAKLKALRDAQRKQRCEAAALQLSLDRTNAEIKAEREKQAQAPPNDANIKPFAEFITKRANTFEALLRIREAFKYGEGILESELRSASLDTVFDQCETWSKNDYAQNILSTVDELVATGKSMAEQGADVHDCSELRKLVDEITTIYKSHACKWHREMTRRRCRDKLAGDFDADRVKLLTWCRQQVAALANVTEPDHVQEFCASFYNNTAVMESNFLVLMEMSENLLPSAEIEAQLMELAEVWLGLEMQAYEKLRSTLLDLHAKAGIEALARQWPDFADRFDPFLVEAQRILNIPTDEESKAVAAPLKDAAKELQANADPHRLIVAHISDFALREECLKEHYNAIHKAAFSKLTLMTQAFPGLYAYPRKAEYTDRMAELSEWIEAKSRSQAWKDLLARVDRMKRIIEDNENALSSTEERY